MTTKILHCNKTFWGIAIEKFAFREWGSTVRIQVLLRSRSVLEVPVLLPHLLLVEAWLMCCNGRDVAHDNKVKSYTLATSMGSEASAASAFKNASVSAIWRSLYAFDAST